MANSPSNHPMHIRLAEERRDMILGAVTRFAASAFDEEWSRFRPGQVLDFFVKHLGPPVYNQASQDARRFLLERIEDLDATFYEQEETPWQPAENWRISRSRLPALDLQDVSPYPACGLAGAGTGTIFSAHP